MKQLFWLTLLLLTQATVPVKAETGTDSLRLVLKALPAEERLARLNELASVYYDQGGGMYPKWFYKEVTEQQNEEYLPNALFTSSVIIMPRNRTACAIIWPKQNLCS